MDQSDLLKLTTPSKWGKAMRKSGRKIDDRKMYELIRTGKVKAIRIGDMNFIDPAEMELAYFVDMPVEKFSNIRYELEAMRMNSADLWNALEEINARILQLETKS